MSEAALHKSHAGRWIISVVLGVVLYVGSARPVTLSYDRPKGALLPRSWEDPLRAFYQPAFWLWNQPPLSEFAEEWFALWVWILD